MTSPVARWLRAALASAVLVAAVTAVVTLLEPRVPPLGLGELYLLAVVPIALVYGSAAAAAVSLASMAAFNYFCLPPRYTLDPGTSERWSVLAAFLVSSLVISELAARSQREARRSARLADEQAALRRVATLVAQGVPPPEVFAAVAREVGLLLGVDSTHMARYELDETATGVATWSPAGDQIPVGTRVVLAGESVAGSVFRTGRPARMHDYENAPGPAAALGRELGLRSSVGAPIVVDQRLWGVLIASSKTDRRLPVDAEARIGAFAELVATTISNTEARTETARLTEDQAALRRVATLVAQGVPPGELFRAVTEELGTLLGTDFAGMVRYEKDDAVTVVATWAAAGEQPEAGARWPLDEADLVTTVLRTGRPARIDGHEGIPARLAAVHEELGIRSTVASPIVVDGRPWGGLVVHSKQTEPLPPDTGSRVMRFAALVATALSNAQARVEVHRLADEQAALRRVATLVAQGVPPSELFAAVTEEVRRVLPAEFVALGRYEADDKMTTVATSGRLGTPWPVGRPWALGGNNVSTMVFETGRAARVDTYADASGAVGVAARGRGFHSSVGAPIIVEGRLRGVITASARPEEALPADAEARLAPFTELVAMAISNIEARREVAASRARIVAATDEERRRVVRDLHDGAQARLVHTILTLKLANRALQNEEEDLPFLLTEALDQAEQATAELRELSHGLLPVALTQGGLSAGVAALGSRMPVPVEIGVSVGRLPSVVEATAYFVVAEALTNVAKHARAGHAGVTARIEHGTLSVEVRDDGVGGARPDGTGLVGLADRLAAVDGELRVESPADGGTLLAATIPLPG